MVGKRGLVMGVANDHSIAWGIAKALAEHGAELAFTYQGEALGKRVKPLAGKLGATLVLPCDVKISPRSTRPSPRSKNPGAASISSSIASLIPTRLN